MFRSSPRRASLLLTFAMALIAGPASAGPIDMLGGYWSLQFGDTDVACGTQCPTDISELAVYREFDMMGTGSIAWSRQSGSALASVNLVGTGSELETEDTYLFQLVISRSVFATVGAEATSSAYAQASAALGGRIGFRLDEAALYTGTAFGGISSGMILQPGTYEYFLTGTLDDGLSTGIVRAGQQAAASDLTLFSMRFESVSVPEPGTLALLGAGLLGMAAVQRRRKIRH